MCKWCLLNFQSNDVKRRFQFIVDIIDYDEHFIKSSNHLSGAHYDIRWRHVNSNFTSKILHISSILPMKYAPGYINNEYYPRKMKYYDVHCTCNDNDFSFNLSRSIRVIETFLTLDERQIRISSIKYEWNHKEHYFDIHL